VPIEPLCNPNSLKLNWFGISEFKLHDFLKSPELHVKPFKNRFGIIRMLRIALWFAQPSYPNIHNIYFVYSTICTVSVYIKCEQSHSKFKRISNFYYKCMIFRLELTRWKSVVFLFDRFFSVESWNSEFDPI
jgi:hypothetical protein